MKWNMFRKLFLQCVFALFPLLMYGKNGPEHVKDMMAVFGPSEKPELRQFFENLTNLIDNRDPELTLRLKRIAPNFTEGKYTHRLYFHWGFDGRPQDSWALRERVELATDDPQIQEELFGAILAIQNVRMEKAMLYVQISFVDLTDSSKSLSIDEIMAIAALAYDTHILGDYIEGTATTAKALMPMDKIADDVLKAFYRIQKADKVFQENPERNVFLKLFNHKMRDAAKPSTKSDSAQKQADAAKKMLRVMQEMAPRLLRMTGTIRRLLRLKDLESAEFRKAA